MEYVHKLHYTPVKCSAKIFHMYSILKINKCEYIIERTNNRMNYSNETLKNVKQLELNCKFILN